MPILIQIILATSIISLAALGGAAALLLHKHALQKILFPLVSLSAGTMLGAAFFHLLPESLEDLAAEQAMLYVLLSFLSFYLIEKFLLWHHCHGEDCELDAKTYGHMNLIGDSVHNFIDGLIIAVAFIADPTLGVVTAIAVASHELPQEIGDFGVLLHAGWQYKKALLANFLVALTVVLGGVFGFFLAEGSEQVAHLLMPVAAGAFLYIAASDLLPELRQHRGHKQSMISITLLAAGLALMYFIGMLEPGH
ncbi:MAG: ZIP family metal transporter [Patescibacteria group bacterium]